MSDKVFVTAIVTFEADLADADPDLIQIDRVHDAACLAVSGKVEIEEILSWEPKP